MKRFFPSWRPFLEPCPDALSCGSGKDGAGTLYLLLRHALKLEFRGLPTILNT